MLSLSPSHSLGSITTVCGKTVSDLYRSIHHTIDSGLCHSRLAAFTAIRTALDLVLFDEEYDDIEEEFRVVSQDEVVIEAVIADQSAPQHTSNLEVSARWVAVFGTFFKPICFLTSRIEVGARTLDLNRLRLVTAE